MAPSDSATATHPAGSAAGGLVLPAPPLDGRWIRDITFDWTFFLGSTLLVFAIAAAFTAKGGEANVLRVDDATTALDLVIPVLLGGPHIFFSLVRTYMDVDFKREHRLLLRVTPHVVAFAMMYFVFHEHVQVARERGALQRGLPRRGAAGPHRPALPDEGRAASRATSRARPSSSPASRGRSSSCRTPWRRARRSSSSGSPIFKALAPTWLALAHGRGTALVAWPTGSPTP